MTDDLFSPGVYGASSILTRQEKDGLWRAFFTAVPATACLILSLSKDEPNSKRRKRVAGPLPASTA
ncbi:hypothetical protein [uncultured Methylobacterium sp.]|uniref:hypothetical protein n=1 Tax=uncultured Methylobacterium sp. TaxID=157278 RepID=UPI0035C9C283